VYHGGKTMTGGVTVHAIFWAPPGTSFPSTAPAGARTNALTNEGIVRQFFSDVAAASTGTAGSACTTSSCNVFTVEPQYAWGTSVGGITSGQNTIHFNNTATTYPSGFTPSDNVINDTDAIPSSAAAGPNCTSPLSATYCVTDQQVQVEVSKLVAAAGGSSVAGLQNLWYVFLPANIDECISQDVCGTNAFGGYHSLSNIDSGNGLTIYAVTIDPVIETGSIAQGADPQGNPDGESIVDIAGHETNEAMTDPEGTGYMNPNGWEVADMCEFGPQNGTPLGFANDPTDTTSANNGSPFNQVINGHDYLIQEMWSNDGTAGNPVPSCVQGTDQTSNPLPLPEVNLTQFSGHVTGNIGSTTPGVGVTVNLLRTGQVVDTASAFTGGDGSWSLTLPNHVVGDDRDEIDVNYTGGPNSLQNEVILTGNGGNPFTESGWTGWTDLDNGSFLTNNDQAPWATALTAGGPSLSMGPCFQTGVLSYAINGATQANSPTDFCGTASDIADTPLSAPVARSDAFTDSSNDNRAFQPADLPTSNPTGGLVSLMVPVGEPDSLSSFANANFPSTGFPTCTADLTAQTVTCSGLVPGNPYALTDGGQTVGRSADDTGTVVAQLTLHRGDSVALSNGSRTLTTLHVADLQVSINDANPGAVAGGTCSPDQYWGGPLSSEPMNTSAGEAGVAGTGTICPSSGNASGLPTPAGQTDEASGGQTNVALPDVADTSPIQGETVYGAFTALSESTGAALPISVSIAPASGGAPVFQSTNTDTDTGVAVPALKPGTYKATWTVTDPNGDTRILSTRFIEQPGLQGSQGSSPSGSKPKVKCKVVKNHKIKCTVTYSKSKKGTVRVAVHHGGKLVALGHAKLAHGRATLTMHVLRDPKRGAWRITIVLSQTSHKATTVTVPVK
jgi:hypothetical protein